MVLLKGVDERGLVFFSHYTSRKGRELEGEPAGRAPVPLVAARPAGAGGREGRAPGSGRVGFVLRHASARRPARSARVAAERAARIAGRAGGAASQRSRANLAKARCRGRRRGAGSSSRRTPGSSGSTARAASTTASATSATPRARAAGRSTASFRDAYVTVAATETGPSRPPRETATEGGQPLVPGGADRDHPLDCVLERPRRHLVARLASGTRRP